MSLPQRRPRARNPRQVLGRIRRRRFLTRTALVAALVAGGMAALLPSSSLAAPEVYTLPATGTITVRGHGNGHGKGLSQYGAQGAALAGLTAAQIVAFYYPNTTLGKADPSTSIRVQLSGGNANTTVLSADQLSVVDVAGKALPGVANPLPSSGVSQYRLVPSSSGLALQALKGGSWTAAATSLPDQAYFRSGAGYVRLMRADGGSTDYRGVVGAIRQGAGEATVNRVGIEQYTMGVVPREMPASWKPAALQAQAIAARTYALNSASNATGRPWDICDTSQCQVYGGMTRYSSSGSVLWNDYPPAAEGSASQILTYSGRPAFTQYSASNGGWTADGDQPYLVSRKDPYDNAASGDPWLNWTRQVSVDTIASYYGMARVSTIQITGRDGNGDWGGRVTSAVVTGVDGSGATRQVTSTGFGLQAALGVPHQWFVLGASTPVGYLDAVTANSDGTFTARGWTMDPGATQSSIAVRISVAGTDTSVTADQSRPDVARAYGTGYDRYGFRTTISVPAGAQQVCAYGVTTSGSPGSLGCKTVTGPGATANRAPIGHLDGLHDNGDGSFVAKGWTLDPDATDRSIQVRVDVDGAVQASVRTDVARADVARVYGTTYNAFGYAVPITVGSGTHEVCAYGLDATAATPARLGCSTVTVAAVPNNHSAPIGNLDGLRDNGGGAYLARGWTFDPDATDRSIQVRVDVDGAPVATVASDGARSDVARAFGTSFDRFGFSVPVTIASGNHEVCAYGLDATTAAPTKLGCSTVTPAATAGKRLPIGPLDGVREVSRGSYLAKGWSLDPDQPNQSIQVRIEIDGAPAATGTADLARADVARAYGSSYDKYGYAIAFTATEGAHEVCASGLDPSDGKAASLGCAQIVVSPVTTNGTRSPIGHLDGVGTANGGYLVKGWAFDPDHPNASVQVRIEVDGNAVATNAATRARADVQRVYGTGYAGYGFWVPADLAAGSHRVCASAIDLDTGTPAVLGCTTVTAG